jgi:hypothetical protein
VGKDMCDNWMVYHFIKVLARGGYLFFNWYLRLGFDFLMVGSAKYLPRKAFHFGATPAKNNDRSLI